MAIKMNKKVLVEVSGRHVHLSQADIERLFGKGHKLRMIKKLSQASDFAAEETVTIMANGRGLGHVRVIGPARKATQVELARTDARFLKINPPLSVSNNLKGAAEIKIKGGAGEITIKAAIIAARHLHCSAEEAKKLRLKNGEKIKIRVAGKRALIFENVVVRTGKGFELAVHLDTDEGNAAGIDGQSKGEIV
jgi:putative phosphotransacetylase